VPRSSKYHPDAILDAARTLLPAQRPRRGHGTKCRNGTRPVGIGSITG